jgi:7,8-dihydropterin-6-yl-methyl-4-(beta-D-ribofuranosyl)aminobenzene 5'-phosphate synthase
MMRRALLSIAIAVVAACAASPAPAPAPVPVTAGASGNRITNLYDAFGDAPGTTKDWGFSALVVYEGHTILFDSGRNADLFAQNTKALGVDLSTVEIAILSHAHNDHASGFDHLLAVNPKVKLFLPYDDDLGVPRRKDRPPSTGRYWKANVSWVEKSEEVMPGVTLVATTSPNLGYFDRYPPHEKEPELEGLPEVSLSLRTPKGEVVIVGCSHSGVERIVDETKSVTKRNVDMVMGGFHLLPYSEDRIASLVTTMRALGVTRVAPAHCTGDPGQRLFKAAYGAACTPAGLGTTIAF